MAKTGRVFRATEEVAGIIYNSVGKQFPEYSFSLHLLPFHEKPSVFYYEIHIDGERCPEEVRVFIEECLNRLFPSGKTPLENK